MTIKSACDSQIVLNGNTVLIREQGMPEVTYQVNNCEAVLGQYNGQKVSMEEFSKLTDHVYQNIVF